MNLTHDAMLVSLRIAAWSGRQYDRKASTHVAVHHEASVSAGRYNKCLLPKAAFAALTATMSAARSAHYAQTLPWDDQGSPAAHRRQLRGLHGADGRTPRAHGARARPLHRGLRRQHRQGPTRPRQAVPHRGLSLEGSAPGQVRPALPDHPGARLRPFPGETRLRRHRPRQARHREPDRGAAARRRGRPLPAPRRGRGAGLGTVCRRTTRASRWCSGTR